MSEQWVTVGRIGSAHGIRGWNRIISFTQPVDNILNYSPWQMKINGEWQEIKISSGQPHGQHVIAHIVGSNDRDQAQALTGADIAISKEQLAKLKDDEYYWSDLEGLTVINQDGTELGQVQGLMETGANDVLVIKGEKELAIPYLPGTYVTKVDLAKQAIHVNWDPEF